MKEATCIGCGCSDTRACPGGCSWFEVDRERGVGLCSSCSNLPIDDVIDLFHVCIGCSGIVFESSAWIVFGELAACSRQCGEQWAENNAAPGYRPGELNFSIERFVDGAPAAELELGDVRLER